MRRPRCRRAPLRSAGARPGPRWRRAALATALVASLGACDRSSGHPYEQYVEETIPKIEAQLGLEFTSPPRLEERSREQLTEFLTEKFDEERSMRMLVGAERTYKRLGLLPSDLELRPYMLALLTEQIAGYYDPSTKTLYVMEGADRTIARLTVSHELVHALQDQHFNLDSVQKVEGDNDRQMAAQAMLEGQATYAHFMVMMGDEESIPGGWGTVREGIRSGIATQPLLGTAPLILQETLIFPYLSGAEFARRARRLRPDRPVFDSIPQSTEQILHEAAYFGTYDPPTTITLPPLAPGATAVYENNLGEFETRVFLYQHWRDETAASRGATGWDGDRYVLFDTPAGEGIAWVLVWDSAVDAGEFVDAVVRGISRRFGAPEPRYPAQGIREYTARGRTLRITVSEVQGRPVVMYVDVPEGGNLAPIDLRRIRLEQP